VQRKEPSSDPNDSALAAAGANARGSRLAAAARAVGERTQAKCDIDSFPYEVDALIGEAEIDGYVRI
jgi:hypothetical protein